MSKTIDSSILVSKELDEQTKKKLYKYAKASLYNLYPPPKDEVEYIKKRIKKRIKQIKYDIDIARREGKNEVSFSMHIGEVTDYASEPTAPEFEYIL